MSDASVLCTLFITILSHYKEQTFLNCSIGGGGCSGGGGGGGGGGSGGGST